MINENEQLALEERIHAKSVARDDRLSVRKNNQEVFRREFQDAVKRECRPQVVAFGECAKKQGPMVVFRCRNECNTSKSINY